MKINSQPVFLALNQDLLGLFQVEDSLLAENINVLYIELTGLVCCNNSWQLFVNHISCCLSGSHAPAQKEAKSYYKHRQKKYFMIDLNKLLWHHIVCNNHNEVDAKLGVKIGKKLTY